MSADLNFLGWEEGKMKFVIWIIQQILISQNKVKKEKKKKKKKKVVTIKVNFKV